MQGDDAGQGLAADRKICDRIFAAWRGLSAQIPQSVNSDAELQNWVTVCSTSTTRLYVFERGLDQAVVMGGSLSRDREAQQ